MLDPVHVRLDGAPHRRARVGVRRNGQPRFVGDPDSEVEQVRRQLGSRGIRAGRQAAA